MISRSLLAILVWDEILIVVIDSAGNVWSSVLTIGRSNLDALDENADVSPFSSYESGRSSSKFIHDMQSNCN